MYKVIHANPSNIGFFADIATEEGELIATASVCKDSRKGPYLFSYDPFSSAHDKALRKYTHRYFFWKSLTGYKQDPLAHWILKEAQKRYDMQEALAYMDHVCLYDPLTRIYHIRDEPWANGELHEIWEQYARSRKMRLVNGLQSMDAVALYKVALNFYFGNQNV